MEALRSWRCCTLFGRLRIILLIWFIVVIVSVKAQFQQQGQKLVGLGGSGNSAQGFSVAINTDGTTALVGGYYDASFTGAAWVFTRNETGWYQQGPKLTYQDRLGYAVALSSDGNVGLLGAVEDDGGIGCAWFFKRTGQTWTRDIRLTGSGNIGASNQGNALSLSSDGSVAIIGGSSDDSYRGACWAWVNINATWIQQKLVGNGGTSNAGQGTAVAVSGDGRTAASGGSDSGAGAVWIFVQNGSGIWEQQGLKMIGPTANQFGSALSLNHDGSVLLVGAQGDNASIGAAFVLERNASGIWEQKTKLFGTGNNQQALQGSSVSLDDDGNTALVGGPGGPGNIGGSWIFRRNGSNHWNQVGPKLVGTESAGQYTFQGQGVALSGDGRTAIVGGYADSGYIGATWVFIDTTSATPSMSPSTGQPSTFQPSLTPTNVLASKTLDSTELSSGALIGILAGVFVALIVVLLFLRRTRSSKKRNLHEDIGLAVRKVAHIVSTFARHLKNNCCAGICITRQNAKQANPTTYKRTVIWRTKSAASATTSWPTIISPTERTFTEDSIPATTRNVRSDDDTPRDAGTSQGNMTDYSDLQVITEASRSIPQLSLSKQNAERIDVFISHVKKETGPIATLFFDEIHKVLPGSKCFLDVEEAFLLPELTGRAGACKVLMVLASSGYWSRPFCVIEMVSARKGGAKLLTVNIVNSGEVGFDYSKHLEKLETDGKTFVQGLMKDSAWNILIEQRITVDDVHDAFKWFLTFKGTEYHPMNAAEVRQAEIRHSLKKLKDLM